MARLSARTYGSLLTAVGVLLAGIHVRTALDLWSKPTVMVVEAFVPLELSLIVALVGVLAVEERLCLDRFADRMLVWAGIGTVVLGAVAGWVFVDAAVRGRPVPETRRMVVSAATLGTVVGVVVGIYDGRGRREQRRGDRLTGVNDTLRTATREVVNATTREGLEQGVCDRLTRSALYDAAWIGRYSPGATTVAPIAWAGHDEAYIESLEVSVDPDESIGQGPGGEAIQTGELQAVQDVAAEPTLEPWRDMLAERDVASLAVVPLVGDDAVHGILSVYADRTFVFDAPEREALTELGESIGNAIDSIRARDRLSRRERELARQNERLDEFASVVSHDLRSPLNVATGNIELARTGEDDRLDRAANALDRMNELIDDVLTLAREGRTVSEFESLDLRGVAEAAWATTDTPDATLGFEGDLGTVRGDEKRVVQVFENLFRNSVEHGSTETGTEESAGTGGATVTVGRTDDGFYVADGGPGIPESERDEVFEAGFSTDPEGTGLGLNIVRTIGEAHGWEVRATESAAGGARFEFDGVEPGDSD
ncbi:HAMP domain-containing sensor histidine kinase [Haloplanus salilacus]|uniref:receiver/sensor box histidine kinase n=1 Tax=Haloplanus salilacus TaxID=2949994 RepID=UPI0030CBE01B